MPPIIKVENISKRYFIAHNQPPRDQSLCEMLAAPFQKRLPKRTAEEFWALKDINFQVEPGDRIGIIGRNGAGKSTLLKVLSKITTPTTGRISIEGRIASLLEVGTGFHAELTGRENIFLNGAILGMKRAEIKRNFDAIVDFAGVGKFLDTPVKRYSSGMYVRLAFAVAAHLEPEILVVDEVLAVGDAEFQKKCLSKMNAISREGGRTILFVSHNMGAIQALCTKGIFLRRGEIVQYGDVGPCIELYAQTSLNRGETKNEMDRYRENGGVLGKVHFDRIEFVNAAGEITVPHTGQEGIRIRIYYVSQQQTLPYLQIALTMHSMYDLLTHFDSDISATTPLRNLPGCGYVDCELPRIPFTHGNYTMSLLMNESGNRMDFIRDYPFRIEDGSYYGSSRNCSSSSQEGRIVMIPYQWTPQPNEPK